MVENKMIIELAKLAARHKMVPFFGAGASIGHLSLDWDRIVGAMADKLMISNTDSLEVAQQYEDTFGMSGLCDFLAERLLVKSYDENKDIAPLILISLGIGVLYTTNQDKIFEQCAMQYGRHYRIIVTLDDLAGSRPGDPYLIKYHGDLSHPESLIFTQRSYKKRIEDVDHFLNIRMRSDLLAKSFVFIGYSFRDPNIIQLFDELSSAFRGSLPPSYLIAYSYSNELEILHNKYGINIVDPVRETGISNKSEAFESFLSALCEKTRTLKTERDISELFRPAIPPSVKVVTKWEISGVEAKVNSYQFDQAIAIFRASFDASLIPDKYQDRVASMFIKLAKDCSNRNQSDMLTGAAFNLALNLHNSAKVLAAVQATAQVRGQMSPLDIFTPQVKNFSEEVRPVAAALAIEFLREWKIEINDTFRVHVTRWLEGYNEFPDEVINYIKSQVDFAWSKPTIYEHPFSYLRRVARPGKVPTYNEIRSAMLGMVPKIFSKPYEE
jgi:hypothetical protein